MPRSPKDNQEIRDARREEILRGAARVFTEKGFAQAKISDIAAASGLSHGLVYHYFDSKEAVFGAIVDQMIAKIDADMEVDPAITGYARLAVSIERSRDRICQGGVEAGRVIAQAMMQGAVPDHLRQRLLDHMRAAHARAVEIIADAQAAGEIEPGIPPAELASALVCLMRGMSIRMPGMPELPFPLPSTDTILKLLRPVAERPVKPRPPKHAPSPKRRALRGAHVARARTR